MLILLTSILTSILNLFSIRWTSESVKLFQLFVIDIISWMKLIDILKNFDLKQIRVALYFTLFSTIFINETRKNFEIIRFIFLRRFNVKLKRKHVRAGGTIS